MLSSRQLSSAMAACAALRRDEFRDTMFELRRLCVAALQEEAGYTAELRAKPEFHGFLIGRGGSNIRELRDRTNTRIVFPTVNDPDQELITITVSYTHLTLPTKRIV